MLSAVAAILALTTQPDYTLTTITRLVQPYDLRAMNDEFQQATLISEKAGIGTFRIVYHLFHEQNVSSDSAWRVHDKGMKEYLRPRPAANWDAALRTQIRSDLKKDGIDPDLLDDKTLVERVSSWALNRSQFNTQFGAWMVEFKNGAPAVPQSLREAFDANEPKGQTDQDLFDRELLGKQMYINRTHGACTSSSNYLATILRAVGIPTRIIVTVPVADPNDPTQLALLSKAIHHNLTRKTVLSGIGGGGFSNHLFNEVFVGGKWVRLNYSMLGQPIVDRNYEGLMTHIYTANDLSEIPFATTWGPRFGYGNGPKLSSVNPYQLVSAKDNIQQLANMPNPPVPVLAHATVTKLLRKSDSGIPSWLSWPKDADVLIVVKEWLPDQDYHQLREFMSDASKSFLLRSDGQTDVTLTYTDDKFSEGNGLFQAYGFKLQRPLTPGVSYHLVVNNGTHKHTWSLATDIVWK